MFENLTDLSQTLRHVTGKAKLTEDNIKDTLREVRMALLEADVALPVVKDFVNSVKACGRHRSVPQPDPGPGLREDRPGELESLMGAANEDLNLSAVPPAVVLMAGLQGANKTTTAGKLARFLKSAEEIRDGGVGRRIPSGSHQAVGNARGRSGRDLLPVRPEPEAGRHRQRRY